MAAYIEHIRALAQRVHESDALPFHWHQYDSNDGLYFFLAQKMAMAGLLDAERNGTTIAVHGLTPQGQKLTDAPADLPNAFLDDLQQALYENTPPRHTMQ